MGLQVRSSKILDEVAATGAGSRFEPLQGPFLDRTFQATGQTTAGAGSAVVDVEVSNDGSNWIVSGTITLTLGVTTATDGFTTRAPWKYVRGNVTTLSGTNAKASLWMGLLV